MPTPAPPQTLAEYTNRIASRQVRPLWEHLASLVTKEPQIDAQPYLWEYDALRPILLESAELISEEDAERRVLILENPGLSGQSAVTNTLFAGLQLLMPSEVAPLHRHSQSALRFIIESQDAYTTVNGERVDMSPGDLVLTPAWSWHHHGHEGQEPAFWLDVLDIPLIRSVGARFVEHDSAPESQPMIEPSGMFVHYPLAPMRDALDTMNKHSQADASLGFKMKYTNPATGGPVMPAISAFLQLLPKGFCGRPYQSSEGAIYCVASGSGTVSVGVGKDRIVLSYSSNDVFAIPCWCVHAFEAAEETVLFSASDRGLQEHLGIWREQRS